jgi:hypothetical protein
MLISTSKYDTQDVVTFKLVNGDEVVARVVDDQETFFVINKPTTVVPSSQGIGLVQSLFVADLEKNITLAKAHVMMHAPVVDKMRDHYIQTVTGIQTVSKGSIVTNA